MNKLALATILLLIAFIVFVPDETSEPIGFCGATGEIKTISSSDAKKLMKLNKLIKLDNDRFLSLFGYSW